MYMAEEVKKTQTQIQVLNEKLNIELSDEKSKKALLATTFKGLSEHLMRQAILEGMIRGFTFENFLKKDIFAILFRGKDGDTYSLVTSIGHARKIGQKAGQCGKKAPIYTYNQDGSIETCSVTVLKMVNSYIGEYTSLVYFKEYTTGKNLWASKPLSMIAKVAEMHALRSAFPEELDKIYVEEEFDKGSRFSEVVEESASLRMGNTIKEEKINNNEKNNENKESESDRSEKTSDNTLFGKNQ